MAYDTDIAVEGDAPETGGIDPATFVVDDVDDAEFDKLTQARPIPKGRQRVVFRGATLQATGEQAKNPGTPYFLLRGYLVDDDESLDSLREMLFFKYTDEAGDDRVPHQMLMKRLAAFEQASGIRVRGQSAADFIEEVEGLELDVVIKHRKGLGGDKEAEIDRYC